MYQLTYDIQNVYISQIPLVKHIQTKLGDRVAKINNQIFNHA